MASTRPYLLLCLLAASVAGCAHDDVATPPSLESRIEPQGAAAVDGAPTRGAQPVLATLPGRAIVAVKTRDFVDGYEQEIAFAHGPYRTVANGITVAARTTTQPTLDAAVPLDKPTEEGVRAELAARFPHVAMQVVERASSNAYGPYGLALGRAGDDVRCLYAWQYVDANRLPPDAAVRGPVSLRVRLCESATTFDALAAEIDRLQLLPRDAAVARIADEAPQRTRVARNVMRHDAKRHVARRQETRVARETGSVAATMPVAPPPVAPPPVALSQDLPPEAYLGPKAASRPHSAAVASSSY